MEWYQRHWLAIMLPTTLGLIAFFVYFAIRNGSVWNTVFFGLIAGLSLVTPVIRLVFSEFWRPR